MNLGRWLRSFGSLRALAVLMTVGVGVWVVFEILARAGEPAMPLDDSYIHLVYARQLAEGHGFSYVTGQGYTTGATSWLWPTVLSPAFVFGMTGVQAVWAAWVLGALLHVGTVLESARIVRPLAGDVAAVAVGAMCVVFPAFAWFAYSGMETMGLAYALTLTTRLSSEYVEGKRGKKRTACLIAAGLLSPLVRPEGIVGSVLASFALALGGYRAQSNKGGAGLSLSAMLRWAPMAALPLLGPAIIPFNHRLWAGAAVSATAQVKWLLADPYAESSAMWSSVWANVQLLVGNLLQGGPWTRGVLPPVFLWVLVGGVLAMLWLGHRRGFGVRALLVTAVVFATVGVCSYETMLWNRVRYIWPFAPAWLIASACLPAALGVLTVSGGDRNKKVGRYRVVFGIVSPIMLAGAVAWFAMQLPAAVNDVAQSARAIHRQQVTLGKWAKQHLPSDAVIGVNDTGAIAYFSGRATFDIVGLTTEGEAKYWASGPGARFEHYERLDRSTLPTHFFVYPDWMAIPSLLGRELTRATVVDQTILGGTTMVAHEARYDALGSGRLPVGDHSAGRLEATLDVADRDSESQFDYEVRGSRARDARPMVQTLPGSRGTVVDGGRLNRTRDRFVLPALPACSLWFRMASDGELMVTLDGKALEKPAVRYQGNVFSEYSVEIAASDAPRRVEVRRRDGGTFSSLHYWCFRSVRQR